MTRINLLPWREWERQEQKKQFGIWSLLSLLLAGAIMLLIHIQMGAKIDYQLSRNNYISSEISKLDKQIAEISELQKVRRSLLERMEVTEMLFLVYQGLMKLRLLQIVIVKRMKLVLTSLFFQRKELRYSLSLLVWSRKFV